MYEGHLYNHTSISERRDAHILLHITPSHTHTQQPLTRFFLQPPCSELSVRIYVHTHTTHNTSFGLSAPPLSSPFLQADPIALTLYQSLGFRPVNQSSAKSFSLSLSSSSGPSKIIQRVMLEAAEQSGKRLRYYAKSWGQTGNGQVPLAVGSGEGKQGEEGKALGAGS